MNRASDQPRVLEFREAIVPSTRLRTFMLLSHLVLHQKQGRNLWLRPKQEPIESRGDSLNIEISELFVWDRLLCECRGLCVLSVFGREW